MAKKKTAAKKPAAATESEQPAKRNEARAERKRSVLERKPKLKCLRHREAAGKE